MEIVYDVSNVKNVALLLAVPLIPLAMFIQGLLKWRAEARTKAAVTATTRAYGVGACLLFIAFACILWGNVLRVEYAYSHGDFSTVEGTIKGFSASEDGKFVQFTVNDNHFDVSCCAPTPAYRGTPNGSLSPDLLYEGMRVKLTYLKTGEIVQIAKLDKDATM